MSEFTGQICPYCRSEIQPGDAEKVCPSCQIPHHQSCWSENRGCTTFGCELQNSEIAPMPYTPPAAPSAPAASQTFCPNCGNPMTSGQIFCPTCGHKTDAVMDSSSNIAIQQFNATLTATKVKSKKRPVVLVAILVVCILVGIFAGVAIKNKQAEENRDEYLANAEEFLDLIIEAGVNLEDIIDTVQEFWYENIWYDWWGDDINEAIEYALIYMSDELDTAEDYDQQIRNLYAELKNLPDNLPKDDKNELEDICDAVKALYSIYCEYYDMATDPSGSYNSYSADNSEKTDEFIDRYNDLYDLLN